LDEIRNIPMNKRVHLYISGVVQGVFFRDSARRIARSLGVSGWVRNLWDGRVEMVVEGDKEAVDKMVEWCHQGPPGAIVKSVEKTEEDYSGEFSDFDIIW